MTKIKKQRQKINKNNRKELRAQKKAEKSTRLSKSALDRQRYLDSTEYKVSILARQQKSVKRWYKLDNAALMYPITALGESHSIFRLSATLKQDVDPILLQIAINNVFTRFPTMTGTVKTGIFWPYIDKPSIPIVAQLDNNISCRPMPQDGKHPQTRVFYRGKEISCEFFHSATDGTGGLIFLNSLLLAYLEQLGVEITDTTNATDYRDIPNSIEISDRFANIAIRKNAPPRPPVVKCSPFGGTSLPSQLFLCRRGVCSATQLKTIAKAHNATVTELLGALLLMSIAEQNKQCNLTSKHPIKILVPANLRKIFGFDTLRNFTNYIFYTYTGQTALTDVIKDVQEQTRQQFSKEYFQAMVSYNYNSGNHPMLKYVPLVIKKAFMRMIINSQGEGTVNTSTLSNLGMVKAPKGFEQYIDRYDFNLGKGGKNILNFAVATFNDVCTIAISNSTYESIAEQYFFSTLSQLGVDIAIESDVLEGLE